MKYKNSKINYVKKQFLKHLQTFLGYKIIRKKNIFFGPQVGKNIFFYKNYFLSNHVLRTSTGLHSCPNSIIISRTRDKVFYFETQLNGPFPMKSKNPKNKYVKKSFLKHFQAFLGYKFF